MNREQTAEHAAELRKQAAELIRRAEIEEHYAKGGEVQVGDYPGGDHTGWMTCNDPDWHWDLRCDYRPKPKPVECWAGGRRAALMREVEP